jgi:hypothetical protein
MKKRPKPVAPMTHVMNVTAVATPPPPVARVKVNARDSRCLRVRLLTVA